MGAVLIILPGNGEGVQNSSDLSKRSQFIRGDREGKIGKWPDWGTLMKLSKKGMPIVYLIDHG